MGEDALTKTMTLRYPGRCRLCGRDLPARTSAIYEAGSKTVRCLECPEAAEATPGGAPPEPAASAVELGRAGGSARREHERRRARDEERLRARWGRLGGLAVALAEERQSTTAWARGALGEERLGARLDSIASPTAVVLHDRRIPRSKANIDHMVVTPGGVRVIDAKRYKGRPHLRVEGGILRPRVEKLYVGSRHCGSLVDGVLKQVSVVRDALNGAAPVHGVLCFVEAEWPLLGGALTTRGVQVVWPKKLVRVITADSGSTDCSAVSALLARALPPA